MARTVLIQVMILSLMILLGYVLGRRGYITASHSEFLTKLVLDVFFPCSVIAAASSGFDDGNRWQTLGVAAFYYASLIAFTAVAYLIGGILKLEPDRRLIFCSGAAYPNNAFFGHAVVYRRVRPAGCAVGGVEHSGHDAVYLYGADTHAEKKA